jgi:amidophosphoribosyltransferase
MSDLIKHECGIALIRLKKPLQYYIDNYNNPSWAVHKLYLLMEKQHNRGQDGAGVANIKLDMDAGKAYMHRLRSIDSNPITHIFSKIGKKFRKAQEANKALFTNEKWLKDNLEWSGELWLGHLRYGTHGENSIEKCHPMIRQNNWRSRNLVMAGNFNMTNVDQLFDRLVEIGQHPYEKADTVTVMEKIGHFLDEEVQRLFNFYKSEYTNQEISLKIENELDLQKVLMRSCKDFDGGYAMAGLTGNGSAFVARDPNGIRPAYYYENDEVIVVASEKPAIKTAFKADYDQIREIKPGHALLISKDCKVEEKKFLEPKERTSCSFERIYFSRGNDPEIYRERKKLGETLSRQVLEAVGYDLENTVFSYIPNTAETAFLGLMASLEDYLSEVRLSTIGNGEWSKEDLKKALKFHPRVEKLVIKDAQLRTFITDDEHRDEMVAHVYDTTYEVIRKGIDTVVVIDDSIVRGTTLEKSILTMLNRLEPKKIVIVSSAPQIRYPDCYGIDMSRMKDFVAFRAVLKLIQDSHQDNLLDEVYEKCLAAKTNGSDDETNFVQLLYKPFSTQQISNKIAEIITPKNTIAEVEVVYQTIEGLHTACPNHTGNWYFTGNYPTSGGNRVVNQAFINFMENKTVRAY